MLSNNMVERLNEQINKEMYSAYLYLGMSSLMASKGLNGVANWFKVQVQEELAHTQIMYNYVNQQSGRVILKSIDEPPQDFDTVEDVFGKTLEHERIVTGLIHSLVKSAREENDYATEIFLQWFVTEQIEEESNANELLQKVKLIGTDSNGLLMFNNELMQRVFTPPQILQQK